MRAADFTVKAEKVDNTTATVSMRGPYAILAFWEQRNRKLA